MQPSATEITTLTIFMSTALILIFGSMVVYFLFLYQRKRFRHQKKLVEMQESFNQLLLQSKLEIKEQTLDHIGKELHANFSQLVSLININLSTILARSPEDVKESIIETKSLAKHLMSELRSLGASLNTDHIVQIGLANALQNELSRLIKTSPYRVKMEKPDQELKMTPEHQIILFRLCQEVFNNILKYSKATCITVTLKFSEDDKLMLIIADNGIGFNVDLAMQQAAEKESTGLLNMKKRASMINGDFAVESTEGLGTVVKIVVPKSQKT